MHSKLKEVLNCRKMTGDGKKERRKEEKLLRRIDTFITFLAVEDDELVSELQVVRWSGGGTPVSSAVPYCI